MTAYVNGQSAGWLGAAQLGAILVAAVWLLVRGVADACRAGRRGVRR